MKLGTFIVLIYSVLCASCTHQYRSDVVLDRMFAEDKQRNLRLKEEYERQIEVCKPRADRGDVDAQFQCAKAMVGLGDKKNVADGITWLRSSAEGGHAPAQHNLGAVYARGEYVSQDYAAALKWYLLAGQQGYLKSQSMLSTMYYTGQGTDINYSAAAKWCRLAAGQGDLQCMANLAKLYEAGLGVPIDPGEAIRLYEKSGGPAFSNNNIARMYVEGLSGNRPDAVRAARWLCGRDMSSPGEAEYMLGFAYENGKAACTQTYGQHDGSWLSSLGRAREWYMKAAEKGYTGSKESLDRVTRELIASKKMTYELPELYNYEKNKIVIMMTPLAAEGASRRGGSLSECGNDKRLNEARVGELKSISEKLQADGYMVGKVLAVPDCAAIETANAVFGKFEVFTPWANTDDLPSQREAANAALFKLVTEFSGPENLVVVTDRLSVYRLTSHKLEDGELLVLDSGNSTVSPNRGAIPNIKVVGVLSATLTKVK